MCNCNNTTNCGGGCLGQTPCTQTDCSCPIMLNSDCINNVTAEMPCSAIGTGQTLTAVLEQLDAFICTKFDQTVAFFTLINVGTGSQIYKGVNGVGQKEIRSVITTGTLLTNVQNTNDITLGIDEDELLAFVLENQLTYSVANVGTGASVYKDSTTVGNNTQYNLKKLKSTGTTVVITELADEINFEVVTTPLDINITAGANIVVTEPTPNNFVISSTDINITAGANVIVTEPTPNNFVISSTDNIALLENSATTTITGDGTLGNEYQVDVNNLQKVVSIFPYTLLDGDDKYTIFIDNGVSNVIINVPDTLPSNFSVAFVQKGTGDVTITPTGTSVINSALGYKIKGQYYWALLEKELNTVTYYLIGNTKL